MKMMLKKDKGLLSIATLSALLSNILSILTPLFIGFAINAMLGKGEVNFKRVNDYIILALLAYGTQFIFTWILNDVSNRIALKQAQSLRQQSNEKISKLPMSTLDQKSQGDISNIFALDTELVYEAWYQALTQVLNGIFLVILVSIFMLSISVLMTFVVYITVPIVYYVSKLISKKSVRLFKSQQNEAAKLNGLAQEYIARHRLIMTYNYQEEAIQRFNKQNDTLNEVGWKAQVLSALVNPTTRILNNLSTVLVLLSGIYLMSQDRLSFGYLTSFMSYTLMFSRPFNEISAIMSQITSGLAAYDRISNFLSLNEDKDIDIKGDLIGKEIVLEDVSFSYTPDRPLIKGLNLHVKPLSKIAIVGPTGAGKSTLINLLLRFYDCDGGVYKMDYQDTQMISKASVREQMGMVLQEPWLFSGTIRDNLKLGNQYADDTKIWEVLSQVFCDDLVRNMDQGLDTILSPNKTKLSLGQMQLLTIARALLSEAPILILDEATSSVDILTEHKISEVFTKIMESHTSFFIAHRLTTIMDADVILVMNNGSLVEQGTHKELMDKQGFYYDLLMSQYPSL